MDKHEQEKTFVQCLTKALALCAQDAATKRENAGYKVETACRITHNPTGISASAEEHKSQAQNRKAAFKRLADELVPLMVREVRDKVEVEPTDKEVRVYNKNRNKVKDHRVKDKTWTYDEIIDKKGFDEIIKALTQPK